MPPRISSSQQARIVDLYLHGYPEAKIGRVVHTSQPTVSNVVKEFEAVAKTSTLEEAAELYNATDTVKELRGLSLELRRLKTTPNECLEGANLLDQMDQLNIDSKQLASYIRLSRRITKKGFPVEHYFDSVVKLSSLEDETGKSYEDILNEYKIAKEGLEKVKVDKQREEAEVKGLEQKRSSVQAELYRHENDLRKKMVEVNASYEKMEKVVRIEKHLTKTGDTLEDLDEFIDNLAKKKGLNLATCLNMLKEFKK